VSRQGRPKRRLDGDDKKKKKKKKKLKTKAPLVSDLDGIHAPPRSDP